MNFLDLFDIALSARVRTRVGVVGFFLEDQSMEDNSEGSNSAFLAPPPALPSSEVGTGKGERGPESFEKLNSSRTLLLLLYRAQGWLGEVEMSRTGQQKGGGPGGAEACQGWESGCPRRGPAHEKLPCPSPRKKRRRLGLCVNSGEVEEEKGGGGFQ